MGKTYDPEERLLEYAARIIRLVEKLPDTRAGNHGGVDPDIFDEHPHRKSRDVRRSTLNVECWALNVLRQLVAAEQKTSPFLTATAPITARRAARRRQTDLHLSDLFSSDKAPPSNF